MTMLGPQAITMEHRQRRQLDGETAMDWKEQLRFWVDGSERQRKDIAASWHARAEEVGIKVPRVGTVISYLSKCLAGDKDGVSCFFKDRARADLLFEELDVDGAARDDAFEGARKFLETGGAEAPRLVVDVSPWSEARQDVLFQALRSGLIDDGALRPVAVVVAESQWDSVPRSLDEKDGVVVVRVPDAAHAKEKVLELAGDTALVAAPWSFEDEDRWLAIELDGKAMSLAMPDALACYEREGRLPSPPVPKHPLSAIFSEQLKPDERLMQRHVQGSPIRRSLLRHTLGDEPAITKLGWSMKDRATLAAMLGVQATSTERERIEHDLDGLQRGLGAQARAAQPEELQRLREVARRRVVADVLVRVGDELRLFNPTNAPADALRGHRRLHVEVIERVRPAIARLRDHVREWTMDHAEDDPFLEIAVGALDPAGTERDTFTHARACILYSRYIQPKPVVPSTDWRDALQAILADEPPVPSLYVRGPWSTQPMAPGMQQCVLSVRYANEGVGSPGVYPPPCVAAWRWNRDDHAAMVILGSPGDRSYGVHRRAPNLLLLKDRSLIEDDDLWLDLVEASPGCGGDGDRASDIADKHGASLVGDSKILQEAVGVAVEPTVWGRADYHVALCWLVLRRALAHGSTVRLPGRGEVLLDLGNGFLAHLAARCHGRADAPVRASVRAFPLEESLTRHTYNPREPRTQKMGVERLLVTHEAITSDVTTSFGPSMPVGIRLDGGGWRVDVGFSHWAPMAMASNPGVTASIASAVTHGLREAERKRQEEDAYDDYDD
jgi:hypothetical protein